MKKLLPLVAGVFFLGTLAAQTIPNGGFENWNTTTWQDPTGFTSSNDGIVPNGGTANVTQVAGYHGNYGVMLATDSIANQGISAGYIIDGNVGNNGISGGTPYTQEPTGVRFYYKYAPATGGDTAAVLVIFKNSGSVIDSFLATVSATAASYTLHTYTASHSLSTAPDTVVVGAVSSIAALNNGSGHNGSIFTIDSIRFTGVSSQPTSLNGDFETWITDTLLTPTGWYTNYPNVTRSTHASNGTYAMQVATVSSSHNSSGANGQAGTGYYGNCGGPCTEQGGNAYTVPGSNKDTLAFSYMYTPAASGGFAIDTAQVQVTYINLGQQVGGSSINLYDTMATYKDTVLPLAFSGSVDTIIVNINSSFHNNNNGNFNYAPYVGSTFTVDNIYLTSQKSVDLGVKAISATQGIKVYPNPTTSQINVNLTNLSGSLEKIALYDMSGRLLSTQTYAGGLRNTSEVIDMSGLSSGIYLIEATTNNGNFYQKVSKQ